MLQGFATEFSGKAYFAKVNVDENDVSKKTSCSVANFPMFEICNIYYLLPENMYYDTICLVNG